VVEGAHLRTSRSDPAEHSVHVFEHVARRNAEDVESFASKDCVASSVAPRVIAETVPLSVDFNNEPAF
jgi:hypothetical protein